MSEANLDAVRGVYARWGAGDFGGDLDLFDPDAEFTLPPGFPDAGLYEGVGAIGEYTRSLLEAWERLTITAEELTDAGDAVVAAVLQEGTGRGSGVPAEFRYFQVWTFMDGKVIRLENLRDAPGAVGDD